MTTEYHLRAFNLLADQLSSKGMEVGNLISQLASFQIAVPSWALGTGGTRFGRFSMGGEPRNLEEKLADIALLA